MIFGALVGALVFGALGALSSHLIANLLVSVDVISEPVVLFNLIGEEAFHQGIIPGIAAGSVVGLISGYGKGKYAHNNLLKDADAGREAARQNVESYIRSEREEVLDEKITKEKHINVKQEEAININKRLVGDERSINIKQQEEIERQKRETNRQQEEIDQQKAINKAQEDAIQKHKDLLHQNREIYMKERDINVKQQEEIERQKRETDRQQREIERQNKLISENLDKIERLRQKRQHQNFTLRALSKENNSDKNTSLGL